MKRWNDQAAWSRKSGLWQPFIRHVDTEYKNSSFANKHLELISQKPGGSSDVNKYHYYSLSHKEVFLTKFMQ